LNDAKKGFDDAEKFLTEVQSRSGSAHGSLWWIEQDLQEARKYIPQKRGGVAKTG